MGRRVWPRLTGATQWVAAETHLLRLLTHIPWPTITKLQTARSGSSTFRNSSARTGRSRPDIWVLRARTSLDSVTPTFQFRMACSAPPGTIRQDPALEHALRRTLLSAVGLRASGIVHRTRIMA